jgi:hypothetical protein
MKTSKSKHRGKQGSALVTVLLYSGIVTIAVAAMVAFAMNAPVGARKTCNYLRAAAIAEAGVNQAYSQIVTNWAKCSDASAFPLTSYAGGTYDVAVAVVSTNMAVLSSVGTYKGSTATVEADVRNYGGGVIGAPGGGGGTPQGCFAYAIIAGGTMTWTGSDTCNAGGGKVHCNGNYKMTGSQIITGACVSSCGQLWSTGSSKIQADAMAKTWKGSSPGNVSGVALTTNLAAVAITNLDLTPYYNYALSKGMVYSGDQHFMGSGDIAPNGGIMWVNGNLKFSGSGRLIGCFIATGDLDYSGSGDQIQTNNWPAFVSRDGNIDISGVGSKHGLIYARIGTFDISGSGAIYGSIICGGNFDKSGSWSFMCYQDSTPTPPGAGGGTPGKNPDNVVITAWKR